MIKFLPPYFCFIDNQTEDSFQTANENTITKPLVLFKMKKNQETKKNTLPSLCLFIEYY